MKNGLFKMVSATTLAGLMFVGCGGGSSSGGSSTPTALTGTFVDAQVKGLHYKTATQEGDTNEAGEFKYLAGETIEFKLGNLSLGSVNADGLITPYTLAGDTDISNPSDKAVNIALLLQNFDADRTDGMLDVLKLKDMDLSTFSLSDTPATNEGKISTKLPDANLVTNFSLIDAQTAKTTMKNNVALSAIKYNKKFTQAYLDQVTLYEVKKDNGIVISHQFRNGKWLFDDTGSTLVNPTKQEGTYTIDANGALVITDQIDPSVFTGTITTVTADYIEITTSGAITGTVKFYTDKSKAQAELTGSSSTPSISVASGFTQAWLEGRTVYYVQEENGAWTIDDVTFINGKQSYHGGEFAPDYIVNSYGIIRAEQNDDNTYQMYKIFSVDESKIDPLANFDCTEDIATQYYFTNQADAQAFVNSL